jgi:LacI family transcriptional regulator
VPGVTTLADVARRAGVSISTASYVVTGTRPVGDETRQRVLEAIAETGYTPDTVARSLRSSRSETIGLVLPDIRNPFFSSVVDGVETEARAQRQTLLLVNSGEDPDREIEALHQLRSRRVDGLIVGLTRDTPRGALVSLHKSRTPVVFVDRAGPPEFDQVLVANDVATRVMVDHLVGAGHRRIGMIAGVRGISTAEERIEGFRQGLELAGLPLDGSQIVDGGSRRELARQAVTEVLGSGARFDALVIGNNDMALGALEALSNLGLRVPGDIAVVSLDDLPWGHLLASPLTAVVQPSFSMGREAMRLLLRRIAAPDAAPREVRLRPGFVHRSSCGCRSDAPAPGLGDEGAGSSLDGQEAG